MSRKKIKPDTLTVTESMPSAIIDMPEQVGEFDDVQEEELELLPTNADGNTDDGYVNGKTLVGYHPITLEPVYL